MTSPAADVAPRRGFVVVVLAALLIAAGVVDRGDRSTGVVAGPAVDMPTAPAASSVSSTWYCAGGTAASGGAADVTVIVANPGTRELKAVVTVIPSEGRRATRQLTVRGNSIQSLRLQDVAKAGYAAAMVDLDGGQGVVEQTVTGALGASASPCASAASDRWYFADGSTRREATMVLALFNPFPDNAIADMSFSTDQGRSVPRALQGLVIPARSLVIRNIGEFVRRRETLATSVSVRSGRLVVSKLQLHDGGGRKGMALVLGAPSVGAVWRFPEGYVRDGISENVAIYNPSEQEATVDVELALEKGAAEPFELTVPARERITLSANKESRIPKDDSHAITVVRRSGPGVVVERTVDAVPPAPRTGFADTMGARRLSTRWFLVAGSAAPESDEWVVVHNPSRRAAKVSFSVLAGGQRLAVEGLQSLSLAAGRRQAFRLGDHLQRPETPLVVEATAPVVVERTLYRTDGVGFSFSIGIPAP
ncbi:MAG: hypothetical protein QOG87_2061 [Actinomycetota bacterium]|jgi:hypothetical protein